ncbi:MAG: hypothetical protein RBR87_15025 [Bacteroidales bacterium]|nr:hypothetical protein [Bacteroidales bacterium]
MIHTDAIKEHIIPKRTYSNNNEWIVYAEEADLLNVSMYGSTAKDWREANPEHAKKGLNIRDFSSINELVVLSNLENLNSIMISENIDKTVRYKQLRKVAISQLNTLDSNNFIKCMKKLNERTYIEEPKKLKNK